MRSSCQKTPIDATGRFTYCCLNDDEVVVDEMTEKVAKTATKHKLYGVKSILASKCHIDNFPKTVPYITAEDIKKLRFPIMQIMGMNVRVYVLRLPCRGIYVVDNEEQEQVDEDSDDRDEDEMNDLVSSRHETP
ncbi:hypothetical protein MFLAVUS_009580 [Mucor flavus]|uniref:Uncharacterized protein n=1 Tax=Mucor flavus TaxID=439312 RepID=A0ABP9ZAA1_9FUNG